MKVDYMQKPCQRQSSRLGARKIDFIFYHEADLRAALDSNPSATTLEIDGVTIAEPKRWLAVIYATYAYFERVNKPHYAEAARQRYGGKYYKSAGRACGLKHSQFFFAIARFRVQAALYAVCPPSLLTEAEFDDVL